MIVLLLFAYSFISSFLAGKLLFEHSWSKAATEAFMFSTVATVTVFLGAFVLDFLGLRLI